MVSSVHVNWLMNVGGCMHEHHYELRSIHVHTKSIRTLSNMKILFKLPAQKIQQFMTIEMQKLLKNYFTSVPSQYSANMHKCCNKLLLIIG